LTGFPITGSIAMTAQEKTSENFSDEELEEILDLQAPENPFSLREIEANIEENPLLAAALAFTLGLLIGLSLCPRKRE